MLVKIFTFFFEEKKKEKTKKKPWGLWQPGIKNFRFLLHLLYIPSNNNNIIIFRLEINALIFNCTFFLKQKAKVLKYYFPFCYTVLLCFSGGNWS